MTVRDHDGRQLRFEEASSMDAFGAIVNLDANQRQALDHRLNKAEHLFRKCQLILKGRGSHSEELRT